MTLANFVIASVDKTGTTTLFDIVAACRPNRNLVRILDGLQMPPPAWATAP